MNPADLMDLSDALDEGLGTAYERYAIDRFLSELVSREKITKLLEVPANGVMGVPGIKSLAAAASGVAVTLAVPEAEVAEEVRALWAAIGLPADIQVSGWEKTPFESESFDLVWSFCVFEHVPDPGPLIEEMLRVSRRYVLLFTQNRLNPGFFLHRAYHLFKHEPWDHGALWTANARTLATALDERGAQIVATGGVDLPPWPDINMRISPPPDAEEETWNGMYASVRPKVLRRSTEKIIQRIEERSHLESRPHLKKALRAWFEVEAALPSQLLWHTAHHPYVLARKVL